MFPLTSDYCGSLTRLRAGERPHSEVSLARSAEQVTRPLELPADELRELLPWTPLQVLDLRGQTVLTHRLNEQHTGRNRPEERFEQEGSVMRIGKEWTGRVYLFSSHQMPME